MELLADLPTGPLDPYRSSASFNWKFMRLHLDSPEIIKIQSDAYAAMENDSLFSKPDHELSLEEYRHITYQRMQTLYNSKTLYPDDFYSNRIKSSTLGEVFGAFDFSLLARSGLLKGFGLAAIAGMGTERHLNYLPEAMDNNIGFTFCLTEISHGTNTKAVRTEARYNVDDETFVLHTPDFEAAKCWAGCLAKTATNAIVYAQLYTPDDKCHGMHCFIVPIRNPSTMVTYPGLTVYDMGHKLGLNGLDNGVMHFNKYKIPRENLLNRTGDVLPDGSYVSPYKDPSKRFGASMGNLSMGRVTIIGFGLVHLRKCLTIAVRYAAIRKQFGPPGKDEISIIEYPLHQWRLFPYIASMYALYIFRHRFRQHYNDFSDEMMEEGSNGRLALFGQEIHALSCSGKPFSGWEARDAIQECREACGGHGYLAASGFGYMRNDNDANLTYEGDNNVLLQQTSNWLLSHWATRNNGSMSSKLPMGTALFLQDGDMIVKRRWGSEVFGQNDDDQALIRSCLMGYEWLAVWLCSTISEELKARGKTTDVFTLKSETQIFRAHSLSLVYIQHIMGLWFWQSIEKADKALQPVLQRLCALFLLSKLLKHVPLLYEGGLLNNPQLMTRMQFHIKRLLKEILPDAVTLVDTVAPPDFLLNSVLGMSDGKVYEHLEQAMITAPNALTRDKHWKEMYPNRLSAKL